MKQKKKYIVQSNKKKKHKPKGQLETIFYLTLPLPHPSKFNLKVINSDLKLGFCLVQCICIFNTWSGFYNQEKKKT